MSDVIGNTGTTGKALVLLILVSSWVHYPVEKFSHYGIPIWIASICACVSKNNKSVSSLTCSHFQSLKWSLFHVSLDGSVQRGGSHGAGAGLWQNEDVWAAAGLQSWAEHTSPAGSGHAVHQERHAAGEQSAVQWAEHRGGCRNTSPRQRLGWGYTWAETDKNSHYLPQGQKNGI